MTLIIVTINYLWHFNCAFNNILLLSAVYPHLIEPPFDNFDMTFDEQSPPKCTYILGRQKFSRKPKPSKPPIMLIVFIVRRTMYSAKVWENCKLFCADCLRKNVDFNWTKNWGIMPADPKRRKHAAKSKETIWVQFHFWNNYIEWLTYRVFSEICLLRYLLV